MLQNIPFNHCTRVPKAIKEQNYHQFTGRPQASQTHSWERLYSRSLGHLVILHNATQPRPQGFSLKKWVAPPIF